MATEMDEFRAAAADLVKKTDEVKKTAETMTTEMQNLGKETSETKKNADKALSDMTAASARLTDIEQKLARLPSGAAPAEFKSMGQRFVESDEFKAAFGKGEQRGRASFEVKNITSASTSGTSGTTGLVVADRVAGIVQIPPNRPLAIRDLLLPGNTSSSAIDYIKETGFTNNAAFVAENPGTAKPQSDLTFTLTTLGVKTLAHWMLASKQILADAPMLSSYIDGRLRYGLEYVEDQALLLGDGTGNNLLGMMPQATAYVAPAPAVASDTKIDVLRRAMLQAVVALYPATGHIVNPIDWATIELTKDSQGRYIFANPQGVATPTMWGLPVAQSFAMTAGSFLTGAFKYACQIFDRQDATVEVSTENADNFVKNMVTILAEERLALAVYRPQALIKGTY